MQEKSYIQLISNGARINGISTRTELEIQKVPFFYSLVMELESELKASIQKYMHEFQLPQALEWKPRTYCIGLQSNKIISPKQMSILLRIAQNVVCGILLSKRALNFACCALSTLHMYIWSLAKLTQAIEILFKWSISDFCNHVF